MPRRSKFNGVRLVARQRGDGITWYGRFPDPDTGKERDVNLTAMGLTTEELRARWRQKKSDELRDLKRAHNLGVAVARTSVVDAVQRYLADCRARLRDRSLDLYESELVRFVDEIGVSVIQDLTPEILWRYRSTLTQRGLMPSTTTKRLAITHAMLDWLRRGGFTPKLTKDAIGDACRALPGEQPEIRCLSPKEIRALLTASLGILDVRAAATVALTLLLGTRIGELSKLTWAAVKLDAGLAGEVRISPSLAKTKRARVIDLSVSAVAREILERLPRRGHYVVGGESPLSRRRECDRWCQRLQVVDAPWTWKGLRQSCASYLVCAPSIWGSAAPFLTAKQLGHSLTISERHYMGIVRGVPVSARTVESAMEAECEFRAVVARLGGGNETGGVGGVT
jgi:integrase